MFQDFKFEKVLLLCTGTFNPSCCRVRGFSQGWNVEMLNKLQGWNVENPTKFKFCNLETENVEILTHLIQNVLTWPQPFNISTISTFQHFNIEKNLLLCNSWGWRCRCIVRGLFQGWNLNKFQKLKCWNVETQLIHFILKLLIFQHLKVQHFKISSLPDFQDFNLETFSTFQDFNLEETKSNPQSKWSPDGGGENPI